MIDFNPAHAFVYALVALDDLTTRRTMTTKNYVDLANRFREGLELTPDELQELLRHALENKNYLLTSQVTGAMQDAGLNERVLAEISRAHRPGPMHVAPSEVVRMLDEAHYELEHPINITDHGDLGVDPKTSELYQRQHIDSPSQKEREFHRSQPPYDMGEEI